MQLGAANSVATSDFLGLTRYKANVKNTSEFTDAEIKGLLNRALPLLTSKILSIMDEWQFEGQVATADLVADQRIYSFPTDILKIEKIQAKLDNSNTVEVSPLDVREVTDPIVSETDITNRFDNTNPFYETRRNHIKFYSGTISASTGGLKIWYTQESTELSDASDEPNVEEAFQPYLAMHAAREYQSRNVDKTLFNSITSDMTKMEKDITEFYARRQDHRFMQVKPNADASDYR